MAGQLVSVFCASCVVRLHIRRSVTAFHRRHVQSSHSHGISKDRPPPVGLEMLLVCLMMQAWVISFCVQGIFHADDSYQIKVHVTRCEDWSPEENIQAPSSSPYLSKDARRMHLY